MDEEKNVEGLTDRVASERAELFDRLAQGVPPAAGRYDFNHTICENCWFERSPGRFPIQLVRDRGDNRVDQCCTCGTFKVTRIWVRIDPKVETVLCGPGFHDED